MGSLTSDQIKQSIKKLFKDNNLEFKSLTHEETPTSEDSARVRGLPLSTGVKAMLLVNKKSDENVLALVAAHKRIDIKKVTVEYRKVKEGAKLTLEKPEIIKERYDLVIGSVPPFGEVMGIPTYIDKSVFEEETSAFNIADKKESLICKTVDLQKILKGTVGDFAK